MELCQTWTSYTEAGPLLADAPLPSDIWETNNKKHAD